MTRRGTATAVDVLAGRQPWAVECGDALEWLRTLPDDSADLLFTSPPYLRARTYGIDAGRGVEDWTAWMVEFVRLAVTKVRGLVAVNCEGQTTDYSYQPSPFLLAADLYRAGFNLRKPAVFHRVGIPGSGGPDWLRNDWEPIVCVTRPGRLPWSDNTACGHTSQYEVGGRMSYRNAEGVRKNARDKDATREARQSKSVPSWLREGMHAGIQNDYRVPDIVNPGNVVRCNVGGGQMGHALASENEAPFPLKLAEFFVLSFCPPGGVALDPFTGSGTTAHAAILHGRRFIGCDVRQSQVALAGRRLRAVTPDMFAGRTQANEPAAEVLLTRNA